MKSYTSSPKFALIALALAGLGAFGASSANAGTFTAAGVGTADFSFINGNTQLQLVITNIGTNTFQASAISGLDFTAGGFTLGALSSATATEGLISSPYSAPVSVGADILKALPTHTGRWIETNSPTGITALSGTQPEDMIISASIAGGHGGISNFDPYVFHVGTFVFDVSNVGQNPTFSNADGHVNFLLGTGPDTTVGSGCVDCGGAGTPEPASLGILGLGAAGLLLRRRKA